MMSWVGVSEFVAVAETESFTAAATRLGISTAQVSRKIAALEERLAVKLFYRTTRTVTITETGQVYYNHCRQVLDGLAKAERAISDLQRTPRGKLNVTAPVTFGETRVAPLVNDFVVRWPELEVNLRLTNQVLDLVSESYDLAIRLGHLQHSTMMARRLASRTHYICASPGYVEANGVPETPADLQRHRCLRHTQDHWRLQETGEVRHVPISGSIRCNSGWALVDAARKGVGIVQLPDYYVSVDLQAGRLVSLLDAHRAPDDGIWAIYPNNRHLSPKVRLLVDHLAGGLS